MHHTRESSRGGSPQGSDKVPAVNRSGQTKNGLDCFVDAVRPSLRGMDASTDEVTRRSIDSRFACQSSGCVPRSIHSRFKHPVDETVARRRLPPPDGCPVMLHPHDDLRAGSRRVGFKVRARWLSAGRHRGWPYARRERAIECTFDERWAIVRTMSYQWYGDHWSVWNQFARGATGDPSNGVRAARRLVPAPRRCGKIGKTRVVIASGAAYLRDRMPRGGDLPRLPTATAAILGIRRLLPEGRSPCPAVGRLFHDHPR